MPVKNQPFQFSMRAMRNGVFGLFWGLLVVAPAAADDREVQVNSYTSGSTFFPRVEALDDGGFVVVWRGSAPTNSDLAILGRRLDAQAFPVGDEFRVDIATSGFSISSGPRIEKLSDGRFVVAWRRFSDPTFRFLSSDATPLGGEFEVADLSVLNQVDLAPATDGGFLLTWDCYECGGDGWDAYTQRFDSSGQSISSQTMIHEATPGSQFAPVSMALEQDGFVVAWRDSQQAGNSLRMRRLDVDGNLLGGETQLDVSSDSFINFATAAEGDRLVAALSEFGEEERDSISLFRFDTFGNRVGQEFVVTVGHPYQLVVETASINASGQIDVLGSKLTNAGPNNLDRDVVALEFDFDNGLQAASFQVNSLRDGQQYLADSLRTDDIFLLVWASEASTGDDDAGYSIQARSSFDVILIDGFESGFTEKWHQVVGLEP